MVSIRKLVGLTPKVPQTVTAKPAVPDQTTLDMQLAAQKNNVAAQRVRETLAELLKTNDGLF